MIKTNKGKLKMKGNCVELVADFTVIARNVIKMMVATGWEEREAIEHLKGNVEMSALEEDELAKFMAKRLSEMLAEEREEEHE